MVYTLKKLLFNNKWLRNFCVQLIQLDITGPSDCVKSVFLTNLFLNIISDFDKLYIYSPSRDQNSYPKLIKCFSIYIPTHIIANILNEEDIDIVIEEIVNNKDFEKSNTEIETYESIEELRYPQEHEDCGVIILDDLNEKKHEQS